MSSEDTDLVRDAARDDAAAARLIVRLQPLLGRIARARAGDGAEADEIVAESLARVILRAPQYRGEIPLEHWAARIAVNLACDRARARARRPQVAFDAQVPEPVDAAGERSHEAARAREEVERLLALLDPADRLVVVLLDLEGRSTADIAALTGWSRTAIKVRAFRARRKLRRFALRRQGEAS